MEPKRSEKMSPKLKSSPGRAPPGPARERPAFGIGAMEAAPGLARGIDLAAVVLLALLRVADDLVGARHLLEALLRGDLRVSGVQVGMQLLGQLAIGAANVVFARVARHTQNHIGIIGHSSAPIPAQAQDHTIQVNVRSWRSCANGSRQPTRISSSLSRSWASTPNRRRTRSPSSAACALGRVRTSLPLS